MSSPDFSKGLAIQELDEDLVEKAENIQEFMKEETNNRKTGKAETGRLAIILASERLEELNNEEEEKREELAKYYHKVDKIVEELK